MNHKQEKTRQIRTHKIRWGVGFHRKMKLIQRRAYGFRNFANYRLRVLLECGHLFHKKCTFHKKMG